jgi:predicted nucleic acid-binding protein
VIFVDSNIPMYLVGAEHPNRGAARRVLERLVAQRRRLVTDAEVMQEILHRYTAIRRPEAIGPCLEVLLKVTDEVLPIEQADVEAAWELLQTTSGLSARDAVHAAVMARYGIGTVLSFDPGFDGVDGIERLFD